MLISANISDVVHDASQAGNGMTTESNRRNVVAVNLMVFD
jgi:hypothetical protein